jgi:hypothetical protein
MRIRRKLLYSYGCFSFFYFNRMYLAINLLGINCVTGMSCIMRKKVIDEAGGLQAFGNYIAEDYFLAQEFLSK